MFLDNNFINPRVKAIQDDDVLKYISKSPFEKWLNEKTIFEDKSNLKELYKQWLLGSKYSKIIGLDNFNHIDFTFGVTQSIDDLLVKHSNNRLRVFKFEYHYSYKIHTNFKFIEDEELQVNDWVLISLPFCFNGGFPDNLENILDLCYEKNIPVYIDAAFYGLSYDFILDLTHPAICEVYFSLSKNLGLGFLRTGLRFSKNPFFGPISMQNMYNYSNLCFIDLGLYTINNFDINYILDKYKCFYQQFCFENELIETNCIHIALTDKKIKGFLHQNNITKLGINWNNELLQRIKSRI
jgi:hypothetical protein